MQSDRPRSADTRAFEALVAEVRPVVDEGLARWLGPKIESAAAVGAAVGATASALERLTLRGGKRLRAALVAASYVACGGGDDWTPAMPAMMAVELLQTYLLIHDDWMDDDPVRRGGPSVHVTMRERLGDAAVGDAVAVLAGDLASAFAQEALLEAPLPAERILSAARVFAQIQEEVVIGQIAEMAEDPGEDPAAFRRRIEDTYARKTASYTVVGPLGLGATLAGARPERLAALRTFGRHLGVAFQLCDDLLGAFGDPNSTGKPVWSDIRRGKRTALVAELGDHPALRRVLGRADAPDAAVRSVVRLMEQSGARHRVELRIAELSRLAQEALDGAELPSARGVGLLRGAVSALVERAS